MTENKLKLYFLERRIIQNIAVKIGFIRNNALINSKINRFLNSVTLVVLWSGQLAGYYWQSEVTTTRIELKAVHYRCKIKDSDSCTNFIAEQ